jgi:AAA domain
MATADTNDEVIAAVEALPVVPDNPSSLQQRRDIDKIVLTATDELRNNTEKQPLQYAAIELAARRLHRYGDARIEAVDAITETALDCSLSPEEIQKRFDKGLTAAASGAGRIYDFKPLDLHDLIALEVPPREMVLAPIIPAKGLVMLYAFRGGCKTLTAHGIGAAVSTGHKFLKWTAPKPRKVLLVVVTGPPQGEAGVKHVLAATGAALGAVLAGMVHDQDGDAASPETEQPGLNGVPGFRVIVPDDGGEARVGSGVQTQRPSR